MRRGSMLGPAAYWALVGALGALGAVSLLSIGIFVLAVVVVLVFIGIRKNVDRNATPALMIGAAVVPLLLAWLNRDGPGMVCVATDTGQRCGEQWAPWPFVGAAILLVGLGVALLASARRRRRRQIPDAPYPPNPEPSPPGHGSGVR